jgi:Sec-independent protein translocase protein TatA
MFNVSWGELAVVAGIGLAFIGRRDLPKAAYVVGTQIGRIVGLLQGARARADRFAAQSELRQLQNELRSGLRELDAVRSELAVSMSPNSMIGRTLGPMTPSADNISRNTSMTLHQNVMQQPSSTNKILHSSDLNYNSGTYNGELSHASIEGVSSTKTSPSSITQSSLAVAEQVWANQGIGFSSAAERGVGLSSLNSGYNREQAGSVILSKLIQESLIFDQYDRIVSEQDAALQSKASTIQAKCDALQNVANENVETIVVKTESTTKDGST